jgi:hypothetical protein
MLTFTILNLFGLVWAHFFADFVLQNDKMAMNKSTSIKWLSIHVGVYTLIFFIWGWQFALLNGILHWMTDFVTSKISAHFWKKNDMHWFFTVIGCDQAIHMTCLIGTYFWLVA